MSHKLIRLKESIVGSPQLITQEGMNSVMTYLTERNKDGFELLGAESLEESNLVTKNKDTKTAVIEMSGYLTYKPMFDFATSGDNVSYQGLKQTFKELLEDGYKTIALVQDSGGGMAYNCFDSANYVRQMLDENEAKLIAYVDGASHSASYAWTVIADEIVMSSDSSVGSIGVVIQLMNNSKQLEKQGVERTFVYSGESKVAFDKDGNFSEDFLKEAQDMCDELYTGFIEHTSKHLGVSQEVIRNTQAKAFSAKDAVSLGLAHKVQTYEEFMSYLADVSQERGSVSYLSNFIKPKGETKLMSKQDQQVSLQDMQEKLTELTTMQETLQASLKAKEEEFKELLAEKQTLLADKEELIAQAQAKELEERKAKLSAVLPEDQIESQMSALAGLDKTAFDAVVQAMGGLKKASLETEDFKELGDSGQETPVELSAYEMLVAKTQEKLKVKENK